MTIEEIIKANEDALDAGDFTTLMPSIHFSDIEGWQNLYDILCMFRNVEVEPFCNYTPTSLSTAVVRAREVFRPTNKDIGVMDTADQFSKYIDYMPLFNALGVSITKGLLKSSLGDPDIEIYLLYITKEGLKDKPQYWENVLGREWEEIK